MLGLDEYFDYLECGNCGCLQIIEKPEDMAKYYSSTDYYSFQIEDESWFRKFMRIKRNKYCLFRNDFIGKLLYRFYPETFLHALGELNLKPHSKILEVGSGSGLLIRYLSELGFENLLGIDPYLEKKTKGEGYQLLKKDLYQLDGNEYDFIFFQHSFEHIYDGKKTLKKVIKLLNPDGICVIAIPLKNEYIWNRYGVNWVQIDAPRHFFLHTLKSFNYLLDQVGLENTKTIYDSYAFQFWGSEQYKKGIPLLSLKSYDINPKKSIFTSKQISNFENKSRLLNRKKCGDQAIFFIRKTACDYR